MFSLNKIHDSAFGGIGDRYAHYIDRHHFLGRNAMDDALYATKAKSNVKRNDDSFHIEIAVPGFSKDEITVNVIDSHLIVECTKTQLQDKVPVQILQEYGHNQVSRSFAIPAEVDTDRIESNYKNGILHITLPTSSTKQVRKKSITVK